jgi:hypothetical protein
VLEYHDYLNFNNRELILNKTNNGSFTMINSRNQTWYLVNKGEVKPLVQASDELENEQLSIVYYTDVFSDISYANMYTMGEVTSAVIATASSMIVVLVYMCRFMRDDTHCSFACSCWCYLLNNEYLPWLLWTLSSTIFLGTIWARLVATLSKMDGSIITLISTMAHWGSTGFIIWIMALILEADNPEHILLGPEVNEKPTRLNLNLFLLSLALSLAPVIIYAFDVNILGPDDASLMTGYSYLNTVTNSLDQIKFL